MMIASAVDDAHSTTSISDPSINPMRSEIYRLPKAVIIKSVCLDSIDRRQCRWHRPETQPAIFPSPTASR